MPTIDEIDSNIDENHEVKADNKLNETEEVSPSDNLFTEKQSGEPHVSDNLKQSTDSLENLDEDELNSSGTFEKVDSSDMEEQKCKPFKLDDENETPRLTDEDGWLDILGSGDLKKKVLKTGEGVNTRPERGNFLEVSLTEKLPDETVLEHHDNLRIILGDSDVVQGLDLSIALMETGETAEIIVPARLAYGKIGKPPRIPPDTSIHYHVELKNCREALEEQEFPLNERINIGLSKREKGNFWFGREEYTTAIHCYRRSLDFLDTDNKGCEDSPENLQKLLEMRLIVYNNMAAAQIKIEAYDAALKSLEFVLKTQPNNVKALVRKGKVFSGKGLNNNAVEVLLKASRIEPSNKFIQQELFRLMAKKKNEENAEKMMYKRMFGLDKEQPKPKSSKLHKWGLIIGGVVTALIGVAVYRNIH